VSAEAVEAEVSSNEDRLAAEFAFHATVLDASDSLMLRQFRGFLHAILTFSYESGAVAEAERCVRGHTNTANAIIEGGAERAQSCMHELLLYNVQNNAHCTGQNKLQNASKMTVT